MSHEWISINTLSTVAHTSCGQAHCPFFEDSQKSCLSCEGLRPTELRAQEGPVACGMNLPFLIQREVHKQRFPVRLRAGPCMWLRVKTFFLFYFFISYTGRFFLPWAGFLSCVPMKDG
jgi:hypothetical protein